MGKQSTEQEEDPTEVEIKSTDPEKMCTELVLNPAEQENESTEVEKRCTEAGRSRTEEISSSTLRIPLGVKKRKPNWISFLSVQTLIRLILDDADINRMSKNIS